MFFDLRSGSARCQPSVFSCRADGYEIKSPAKSERRHRGDAEGLKLSDDVRCAAEVEYMSLRLNLNLCEKMAVFLPLLAATPQFPSSIIHQEIKIGAHQRVS